MRSPLLSRDGCARYQPQLESSAIDLQLTHDPVAYDLYLQAGQGPNIFRDAQQLREHDQKRIDLLNAAVARDPGFALAYCKLSSLHDSIYAASRTSTDAQEMEDSPLTIVRWPNPR